MRATRIGQDVRAPRAAVYRALLDAFETGDPARSARRGRSTTLPPTESLPKPPEKSDLMYQIERFHSFIWASGGCFSDFYIHNIDECCWMKDA